MVTTTAPMRMLLTVLTLVSSLPAAVMSSPVKDDHSSDAYVGFVVEGEVYCQGCTTSGSWSLTGATPLQGVRLGVRCKDYKQREIFYLAVKTNKWGWFYEPLKGFNLGGYPMDAFPRICKVYLASSGNPDCDVMTNTNFGITGSPLRYEKTLFNGTKYQADLYSTGPMAFRPKRCRTAEEDEASDVDRWLSVVR